MEAILFYIGLAVICIFVVVNTVLNFMEVATMKRYMKRMDAETRAAMAPKDY